MNDSSNTPVIKETVPTISQKFLNALRVLDTERGFPTKLVISPAICALEDVLQILEDVALYSRAIDQLLEVSMSAGQDEAAIETTANQLRTLFTPERAFCTSTELMVRDRLVKDAGIDPTDSAAVVEHFRKIGKELVFAPLNKGN